MAKLFVEVDDTQFDELMAAHLKEEYMDHKADFLSGRTLGMFDTNPKRDRKKVRKYLKALRKVHDFHSATPISKKDWV